MPKIGNKEFWASVEALSNTSPNGLMPKAELKDVKASVATDGSMSIYIDDVVGGYFGLDASSVVKAIHEGKGKSIKMFINSPGGSVFDGLSIYNAMQDHDADIDIQVTGQASSIASIIALGGKKKPTMRVGTRFMIHNASVVAGGDHRALRAVADIVESISADIVKIYVDATGMDSKEVADLMDKETFFSAEEASERGFALLNTKEEPQNNSTTDSARAEALKVLINCQLQAII